MITRHGALPVSSSRRQKARVDFSGSDCGNLCDVLRNAAPREAAAISSCGERARRGKHSETMGDPIMVQSQLDIENSGIDENDASAPLLPVALADGPAGSETTNCCMIACCAPLAISNGGGGSDPKPTPSSSTSTTAPAQAHKAWANLFKLNVVLTVAAAFWFGGMAIEALKNDALSGEGRRRLMHQHHGDHSHHHHHHGGHFDHDSSSSLDSSELFFHLWKTAEK